MYRMYENKIYRSLPNMYVNPVLYSCNAASLNTVRKLLSRCLATQFPLFAGDLAAKGHCTVYNAIPVKSSLSQQISTQQNNSSRVQWDT